MGLTVLALVILIGLVLAFKWVLVLGRGSDLISVSLTRGAGGGDILVKWLNTLLCKCHFLKMSRRTYATDKVRFAFS